MVMNIDVVDEDAGTEDVRKTRSNRVDGRAVRSDTRDVDKCDEVVLRIVRDLGVGLGVSIVGGVGTTAFKDNDEVTVRDTLSFLPN